MSVREVRRGERFNKALRRIVRNHRGFEKTVEEALEHYARGGPSSTSNRIPGLKGRPVYKDRLRLPGTGKSGGAPIIYYCDDDVVAALLLYLKSEGELALEAEIRDVLRQFDELGPSANSIDS